MIAPFVGELVDEMLAGPFATQMTYIPQHGTAIEFTGILLTSAAIREPGVAARLWVKEGTLPEEARHGDVVETEQGYYVVRADLTKGENRDGAGCLYIDLRVK